MGEVNRMIDLHTHLLPGLDDGARSLEESIEMCWISYKDGVGTIVATPHTLNGLYLNDRDIILKKVEELKEAIKKFGVQSSPACRTGREFGVKDIQPKKKPFFLNSSAIRNLQSAINSDSEFKILPGADVHLSEKTLSLLDEGKLMTVGDGRKYLFIEFPFQGIPYKAEEILFQLKNRGIIPIITHPERNLEIGQRPQRYYEMIRIGCLGQVTAMSLTGEFGARVREVSEKLLKKRLIHFIASDAHSPDRRPPILSEAVRAAERTVGKEEAWKMVTENPRSILEGRHPDVPGPLCP
jgi:protein-tyrosine phosphatase